MKKLLAVFPKESGGEYLANKNLTLHLKKLQSEKVFIEKIKRLQPIWDEKKRFQLLRWFFKSTFYYLKTLKKHKKRGIGVFYSNRLMFLFWAFMYSLVFKKRTKLIFHFQGKHHDTLKEELKKEKSFFKKFFYIFPIYSLIIILEKIAFKRLAKIQVASRVSIKDLRKLYGKFDKEKIVVIPNAYEKEFFYPEEKKHTQKLTFDLLFVGQIDPRKRVKEIIEAFFLIQKETKSHLTIIYPPIVNKEHEKEIEDAFGKKGIFLVKNPKRDLIPQYYQKSDLCLLPSRKEHFPLTYLESIACGLPVITSWLPSLVAIQKRIYPRLLMKKVAPQTIAKTVLNYCHLNNSSKKMIRRKCLKEAGRYSWQKSARQLQKVIERI